MGDLRLDGINQTPRVFLNACIISWLIGLVKEKMGIHIPDSLALNGIRVQTSEEKEASEKKEKTGLTNSESKERLVNLFYRLPSHFHPSRIP
jgi:hypothetical protein